MVQTLQGEYFLEQVKQKLDDGYIDKVYEGRTKTDPALISRLFDQMKVSMGPNDFETIMAARLYGPDAFRAVMSLHIAPLTDYFFEGESPRAQTLFPELYLKDPGVVESALFNTIKVLFLKTLIDHIDDHKLDNSLAIELGSIDRPFIDAFEKQHVKKSFTPNEIQAIEAKQAPIRIMREINQLANTLADKRQGLAALNDNNPLSEEDMSVLGELIGDIRSLGIDVIEGERSIPEVVERIQARLLDVNQCLRILPDHIEPEQSSIAASFSHFFLRTESPPSNVFKEKLVHIKEEIEEVEKRSLESMQDVSHKFSGQ